jgi:hypothetical protein
MPKAVVLKPTIHFRGGWWRVREPTPRPYNSPTAKRWHDAHSFLVWLNQQRFATQWRERTAREMEIARRARYGPIDAAV